MSEELCHLCLAAVVGDAAQTVVCENGREPVVVVVTGGPSHIGMLHSRTSEDRPWGDGVAFIPCDHKGRILGCKQC